MGVTLGLGGSADGRIGAALMAVEAATIPRPAKAVTTAATSTLAVPRWGVVGTGAESFASCMRVGCAQAWRPRIGMSARLPRCRPVGIAYSRSPSEGRQAYSPPMDPLPIEYAAATDGTRIAYTRYPGASPAFLGVNTPGTQAIAFRTVWQREFHTRFLRERSGVYFDWRGTGLSDSLRRPLSIDSLVADLEAVTLAIGEPVDARFTGRACFAGCLHAAEHPTRYRSIQLTGASIRPGENWQGLHNRPGWDLNYSEHLRGLARSYYDVSPREAVRVARLWEEGVPKDTWAAYLEAEKGCDLTDVLPRIAVPAWVTATRPADYEVAAVIASLLPDATLSIYEPQATRPDVADIERERWDVQLGVRLGEPLSRPIDAPRTTTDTADLTPRQREVLGLIVSRGLTDAEIAKELTLSERTVQHHVAGILGKLNVRNRVQAANWAREHGL